MNPPFLSLPNLANRPELDDHRAKFHINHGVALHDKGDLEGALVAYTEAEQYLSLPHLVCRLELDEDRAILNINRGLSIGDKGDLDGALLAYTEAERLLSLPHLTRRPELNEVRAILHIDSGNILLAKGDHQRAFGAFRQAEVLFESPLASWHHLHTGRCLVYANMARFLELMSAPLAWAREKSHRISELLEFPPPVAPGQHDPYAKTRHFAGIFYALWLTWCLKSHHLEEIPRILAAIQGRHLAAQILDELETANATDRPEAIQAYQHLRLELRRIAAQIQGSLGVGHPLEGMGANGRREARPGDTAGTTGGLATLQEKYRSAHQHLLALREQAAQVPGYEGLLHPHRQVDLAALQASLREGEALAIFLDVAHPDFSEEFAWRGVLLLRRRGAPHWQPLEDPNPVIERLEWANAQLSRRRGYRRGGEPPEPALPSAVIPTDLWAGLQGQMEQALWRPLAPRLQGIERLICITHGRLHLLPLELGAPEALRLIHYPGLVFYALRRGVWATPTRPESEQAFTLGLIDYAGDHNDIPLTAAEAEALEGLYRGQAQVWRPLAYVANQTPVVHRLHLACHGARVEQQVVALHTGPGQRLDMARIHQSGVQVQQAFLSACFGGRTAEDLDGNPSGLISALFLRGATAVVGSLLAVSDYWMPLLALLTHQGQVEQGWPLDQAFREAKRRLVAGDWYPTTAERWQSALRKPWCRDWAKAIRRQWQDYNDPWETIARPILTEQGLAPSQQARLRLSYAWENPGSARREAQAQHLAGALVEAVLERLLSQRRPPELDLGVLLYATRLYGEPVLDVAPDATPEQPASPHLRGWWRWLWAK